VGRTAYKATFDLDVTVPTGLMAVNNMPRQAPRTWATASPTWCSRPRRRCPPTLLFFGLGDFDSATTMSAHRDRRGGARRATWRRRSSRWNRPRRCLPSTTITSACRIPLPKLDNIGSPGSSQFFGAMENWGAIYTFEYALLLDPSISTQRDRQGVFGIAAHEMAHQCSATW